MPVKYNKILLIILFVLIIYTAVSLTMAVFNLLLLRKEVNNFKVAKIDWTKMQKSKKNPTYFNILNGSSVKTEAEAVFVPLSAVIDNGPGAVPRLGLEKSDFIIELPAEGEITRILAFFDPHNLVDKIGPVRSARPYFLDFVEEWQGVFAHAGGSPQVLSDLKSGRYNLIDVDEIGPGGRYFWRTQDRPAPHNLFTSSVLLKSAYDVLVSARAKKIKYDEVAWKWTDEHLPNSLLRGGTEGGVKITIDYSTYNYQVEYQYDVDSQKYKRYQGGRPLQTEQGEEILIDNILIAKMGVRVIDKEARLKIQTTGEGEAVICRDGECQNGIWKKPSAGQRIRFYITDEAGESEEVELKPGRTWLNVVPVGRRVEIGN